MSIDQPSPDPGSERRVDRRRFLALAGLGAASAGLAACAGSTTKTGSQSSRSGKAARSSSATTSTSGRGGSTVAPGSASDAAPAGGASAPGRTAGPASRRRLVVLELDGGNDGMSTLVPYGLAGYNDVRQRIAFKPDDLVRLDDHLGLHPNLKKLNERGLAVLQGVGVAEPDGSHFAMMDRWWRGDVTGSAGLPTGFLGRLCDALADPAARISGLSFGAANHPAISASKANTLSLPGGNLNGNLVGADPGDALRSAFQDAYASMMSASGGSDWLSTARRGGKDALEVAAMFADLGDDKDQPNYPGGGFSDSLRAAARLLAADEHLRVIHVPMGGDFDTHQNHPDRHGQLMQQLSDTLVAFLDDLGGRGLADDVLIATTSEFGRTAKDNGSDGLDHGTASVALLLGPVVAGVHGEHPSLTALDPNDDLVATVGFDQYYATIAERWFEVPASEVLPGRAGPIDGIIAV